MNEFPLDVKAIAADLALLAQKHKLIAFKGAFHTSPDSTWRREINFHWTHGRHGAEADLIGLHSELAVTIQIRCEPEREGT